MVKGAENMKSYSSDKVRSFFSNSHYLDYMVLRPLSHISCNWEASWDNESLKYSPEAFSFAEDLNVLIESVASCPRPNRYHDNEDVLAEHVLREMKWPIQKKGKFWKGADYQSILENGAYRDRNQTHLISAATGRTHAALDFGQDHFDEMDEGHMNMLAGVLTIAIYHRYCDGTSLITEEDEETSDLT